MGVYRYTNGGINYVEVTGYGTDPFSGDPDASMAYYNTPGIQRHPASTDLHSFAGQWQLHVRRRV